MLNLALLIIQAYDHKVGFLSLINVGSLLWLFTCDKDIIDQAIILKPASTVGKWFQNLDNTYTPWFKIRWSGLQLLVYSSITFTRPNDIESEQKKNYTRIIKKR